MKAYNREIPAKYVTTDHELQLDVGSSAKTNFVFCKVSSVETERDAQDRPVIVLNVNLEGADLLCVYKPDERVTVRDALLATEEH